MISLNYKGLFFQKTQVIDQKFIRKNQIRKKTHSNYFYAWSQKPFFFPNLSNLEFIYKRWLLTKENKNPPVIKMMTILEEHLQDIKYINSRRNTRIKA